jgi:hypothetical protein
MFLRDFKDEFITGKKPEKVEHDEFNHFKFSPNIIWAQESRMIRWACGTHGEEVDKGFWLGRLKKKQCEDTTIGWRLFKQHAIV